MKAQTALEPTRAEHGSLLVAGVGNVFLGDDGFGVEVARRLAAGALPPGAVVADYGIRGLHLAYDLLDGSFSTLILVDAVALEEPPGTVVVLELYPDDGAGATVHGADEAALPAPPDGREADSAAVPDAHGMDPRTVLDLLRTLGGLGPGRVERVYLVGVRPQRLEAVMGLSDPVAAAVHVAAGTVLDLIGRIPVAESL
jgi:hydrogenase maturation protease